MTVLREKTDADARKIGVQVLDVRLKRVDFPLEISESVYRRMDADASVWQMNCALPARPKAKKSRLMPTGSAK